MKKILMRAGMSPLDTTITPSDIIAKNLIGGNVGNLIYAFSVFRTLMTEEVEVVADHYRIEPADAKKINETYTAYIIPLADAFRPDFVPSLKKYTALIKKLTIPVVVVGVGLRADYEPNLEQKFPFDDAVYAFIQAVLEKSTLVGVRGQITADYLSKLGFKEGVDHTVIGCPSMYAFGANIAIKEPRFTEDSLVGINASKLSPAHVLQFIQRSSELFPNHYFIPQWHKELKLAYLGGPDLQNPTSDYPCSISHPYYQEKKVIYPVNAIKWIELIKQFDLTYGSRLHGNITATIAGTPSLLIAKDARMRELAEYHALTHVTAKELEEGKTMRDYLEQVDFHSPENGQKERFTHFLQFLEKNGLTHIYQAEESIKVPFDRRMEELSHAVPIEAITNVSPAEVSVRMGEYQTVMEKRVSQYRKKADKSNATCKKIKIQLQKAEKQLNRKAVRLALKAVSPFEKSEH